ncbi:MAG: hypothetical protein ACFB12_13510 [Leptolyngbyaceae cyanobacterium]
MATVARVSGQEGPLTSPYDADEDAIIREAEDFTIRITTISHRTYDDYTDFYKANEHNNDYFALMSRVGIGNADKPATKLHFLRHNNQLGNGPIRDMWADQVCVVEDFREAGEANRIFLAFHCFCQTLGGTSESGLRNVLSTVATAVGSMFPGLAPFVMGASVASEGIKYLFEKIDEIPQEVKVVEFSLFPRLTEDNFSGDAPLQTGSYILFFEEVETEGLHLKEDGTISGAVPQDIKPYLVVNVQKGIMLSPGQLDADAANEVLSSYHASPEFLFHGDQQPSNQYLEALQVLGRSHRMGKNMKRYFELKKKQQNDQLTPAESSKINDLARKIHEAMPDLAFAFEELDA